MTTSGRGSAPAKAILLGEHFVVYGVPALSLPLRSLQLHVELGSGASASDGEPVVEHVRACLDVCAKELGGLDPAALSIDVEGAIPVQAGLGSSAALAVATARAWLQASGAGSSPEAERRVADACEAIAHGNPSGIDVATVTTELDVVRFVRGEQPTPLRMADGFGLMLVDTGTRGETAAMVSGVREVHDANPKTFRGYLQRSSYNVAQAERALAAGDVQRLAAAMNSQQGLLDKVGVNTSELQDAVDTALEVGALGAKLTGSGGGGCILALCAAAHLGEISAKLEARGLNVVAAYDTGAKEGV